MTICKITVLKKLYNADLSSECRHTDIQLGTCPYYTKCHIKLRKMYNVQKFHINCETCKNH